jgi:hypothetical protein
MKVRPHSVIAALFLMLLAGGVIPYPRAASSAPAAPSFMEPGSPPALPQAFRITPPHKGKFYYLDAVYNSRTDRFIAFYIESFARDTVYSRVFDAQGRALGSPVKLFDANPKTMGRLSFAYNPVEDEIFLVGAENTYDEIQGIPLDGSGRLPGGVLTIIEIKPHSTEYSGLIPKVYWISAMNQYAVSWGHSLWEKPLDPLNGHYLSVYDKDFVRVSGPRLVRQQTAKNGNCISYICPLKNGLLWGSAEDGAGTKLKPVIWLTDFKGKIQTGFGAEGFAYPEAAGGYNGYVYPVLDTDTSTVLLVWNAADQLFPWDQTKAENHYRLLNLDGSFLSAIRKIPKKQPFQTAPRTMYLTSEKRYFLVCPEYLDIGTINPRLFDYGGKLWGFYMDSRGNLVTKAGAPGAVPVPLTGTFTDPKVGMILQSLTGPAREGALFVAYELEQVLGQTSEAWGLTYK